MKFVQEKLQETQSEHYANESKLGGMFYYLGLQM